MKSKCSSTAWVKFLGVHRGGCLSISRLPTPVINGVRDDWWWLPDGRNRARVRDCDGWLLLKKYPYYSSIERDLIIIIIKLSALDTRREDLSLRRKEKFRVKPAKKGGNMDKLLLLDSRQQPHSGRSNNERLPFDGTVSGTLWWECLLIHLREIGIDN